jgi:acyl-CoA thioester hydrolase
MKHRVRYHETDLQGVMFNSRYLEIIDVAMTEYFRDLGFGPHEVAAVPFDPVLAHVDLTYVSPAFLDDDLEITVQCARIGNASFDLAYRITKDVETEVAHATITYVNISLQARSAAPIPQRIREALEHV